MKHWQAILILLLLASCGGRKSVTQNPTAPSSSASVWSVTQSGTVLEISYGSGASFPQYAALHTESGYFRMNFGPGSGWGTSVVILPSFWSGGTYYQGARTTATWGTSGADLIIAFSSNVSALTVQGQIRLQAPSADSLVATVNASVSGTVVLDARPGEAFKPLSLSSMHVAPNVWDSPSAFVDAQPVAIPDEGWIIQPAMSGALFGLTGGTSGWKTNAPTIEVSMDRTIDVTGWVTRSSNPNDDNVGFWAASPELLRAWQYRLRAIRP